MSSSRQSARSILKKGRTIRLPASSRGSDPRVAKQPAIVEQPKKVRFIDQWEPLKPVFKIERVANRCNPMQVIENPEDYVF